MKPIDDNKMLRYINKAGQMGERNLTRVLEYPLKDELRKELREQRQEYKELRELSASMLRRRGQRPREINRALDAFSAVHVKAEMRRDHSPAAVADMVIHGNHMGLQKSINHLNHYSGRNEQVRTLAVKLMRTEKSGIDSLKPFL